MTHSCPLSARELTNALDGKWSGNQGIARCPAHDDKNPSFSISENPKDGNPLVKCHAGCSQEQVVGTLKDMGLWGFKSKGESNYTNRRTAKPDLDPPARTTEKSKEEKNVERAQEIWNQSRPSENSPVSDYLASRGITIPVPDSLRCHPNLYHAPTKTHFPCMVAQIVNSTTNEPMGIHRTYLAQDGKGKAPVDSAKMMLGSSKGGVIRLGEPEDDGVLMIGEGIETCLSAMQVKGDPAWCALSAGGLETLELPPGDYKVTILADADGTGLEKADAAAKRWVEDEQRKVNIALPPPGKDFNDILRDHLSKSSLNEIKPTVNDFTHPILGIIENAKEVRDPLDEIKDKLEARILTTDEVLSGEVMELIALRHEKREGTAFCENFRKEVLGQKLCRAKTFDDALNKHLKPIKDEDLKKNKTLIYMRERGRGNDKIADNYEKSENTSDEDYEWRQDLQIFTKAGVTYEVNSVFNLQLYLRNDPDIKETFRLNKKTTRVEVTKAIPGSKIKWTKTRILTDEDITSVQVWFSEKRFRFTSTEVAHQISNVAAEKVYNPLVDWLKSLPEWDGKKRLHEVMPKGWSTADNIYTQEVGEIFIKGLVFRIMYPGCEFRLVPILIGRQWIGKSASLKALVGDKWVTDQFIKPGSKDTLQLLRDYLIAELGEMDVLRRAEAEELKQFISSRYDDVRDPYARYSKRHPRSCILVGTSNESAKGLLNDPGENTRFLPLQIRDKVDFKVIKANKDQWFAEAYAWAKTQNHEQTYFKLSKDAEVLANDLRDEYRTEEPLEEAIMEYALEHPEGFTNEQCTQSLVDNKKGSHSNFLKKQVGAVMIKNGYVRKRRPKGFFPEKPDFRPWIYVPPKEESKEENGPLMFCIDCRNSRPLPNEKGKGSCGEKADVWVELYTHLPGGCDFYEKKPEEKTNVVQMSSSYR